MGVVVVGKECSCVLSDVASVYAATLCERMNVSMTPAQVSNFAAG